MQGRRQEQGRGDEEGAKLPEEVVTAPGWRGGSWGP